MMTISFIVAIYQIERYIEACLLSVLPCLRAGDELILVNDGSTDSSRSLAEALIASHPNARIVDKANGGLSSARNAGLRAATCDYVLFLDGDDVVIPEAMAEARQALEQHAPDILVTDYLEWLDDGLGAKRPSRQRSHVPNQLTDAPARHLQETLDDCIPCVWTRLFRRSLFDALGELPFPEWSMYDDLPTTPHLVARARTMYYLPRPTVQYRTRAGSLTQIRSERSCTDMIKAAVRAREATALFPNDIAVQRAGLAFLARKWVDAVKQSRQVPSQSWSLHRDMLDLIAPYLLDAGDDQLHELWQSRRKDDRKVRSHLKLARQSRLIYALINTLVGSIKRSRQHRRQHQRH